MGECDQSRVGSALGEITGLSGLPAAPAEDKLYLHLVGGVRPARWVQGARGNEGARRVSRGSCRRRCNGLRWALPWGSAWGSPWIWPRGLTSTLPWSSPWGFPPERPWLLPWRRCCGTYSGNPVGSHDKLHNTCCGHNRCTCRGSAMPDGHPRALPWQAADYRGHKCAEISPTWKCSITINRLPKYFIVFDQVLRSVLHGRG